MRSAVFIGCALALYLLATLGAVLAALLAPAAIVAAIRRPGFGDL